MTMVCKFCFCNNRKTTSLTDRNFMKFMEYVFLYAENSINMKINAGDNICIECYSVMIRFYKYAIGIKKIQNVFFENNLNDNMISVPAAVSSKVKMIQRDLKPNLSVIQKGIDYYFIHRKDENILYNKDELLNVQFELKMPIVAKKCIFSAEKCVDEDCKNIGLLQNNETALFEDEVHIENISNKESDPLSVPIPEKSCFQNDTECSTLEKNEMVLDIKFEPGIDNEADTFLDDEYIKIIKNPNRRGRPIESDPLIVPIHEKPCFQNDTECSILEKNEMVLDMKFEPGIDNEADTFLDDEYINIIKNPKRRGRPKKTENIIRRQNNEKNIKPVKKYKKKCYKHFWDDYNLYDKLVVQEKRKRNKTITYVEPDDVETDNEEIDNKKKIKKYKLKDVDFEPTHTDDDSNASSASSVDCYDEIGRKLVYLKNERTYPRECEKCDVIVENGSKHYRHYVLYHDPKDYPYVQKKGYLCTQCGYKTNTHFKLRDHELTHGEKLIECNKCPKRFHNRKRLLKHLVLHEEPKLICDYCQKPFWNRADIRLHIRTHTGEKPFACHICGATFAHKGNVNIHIRANHTKEPIQQKKKTKDKLPKKKSNTKKPNNKTKKTIRKRKVHSVEEVDEMDDIPVAVISNRKKNNSTETAKNEKQPQKKSNIKDIKNKTKKNIRKRKVNVVEELDEMDDIPLAVMNNRKRTYPTKEE